MVSRKAVVRKEDLVVVSRFAFKGFGLSSLKSFILLDVWQFGNLCFLVVLFRISLICVSLFPVFSLDCCTLSLLGSHCIFEY